MKSLPTSRNPACFAAPRRLSFLAELILRFAIHNTDSIRFGTVDSALVNPRSPVRTPVFLSLHLFNFHRPASAANASGFLLTALSNARRSTHFAAFSGLRASDKALTSSVNDRFEDDIAVAFENVNHLLYAGDVLGGARLEPRDAKAKVGLLRFSLKHARSSFSSVQFVGVGSRHVLPLQPPGALSTWSR